MSSEKVVWFEQALERDDLSPPYRRLLTKRKIEAQLEELITSDTRRAEPFIDLALFKLSAKIMAGEVEIETVKANLLELASPPANR